MHSFNLYTKDFQYYVNVDYDTETSCEEHGCIEEGICRCSRILNPRVTNVNIEEIKSYICRKIKTPKHVTTQIVLEYCIDRILRLNEIYDTDIWNVQICNGYYGEEIDSVKLKKEKAEEIDKDIDELMKHTTTDQMIEFILEYEYLFLLPELKDNKWEVKIINKDKIVAGADSHMKKVMKEDTDIYKDYDGISAVCLQREDGKYRLIDGYHRIAASKSKKVKIITAIHEE